jgi:hypothetical protein
VVVGPGETPLTRTPLGPYSAAHALVSSATATMASIQGGLLLSQVRRDPQQLRIALNAARNNLRAVAA